MTDQTRAIYDHVVLTAAHWRDEERRYAIVGNLKRAVNSHFGAIVLEELARWIEQHAAGEAPRVDLARLRAMTEQEIAQTTPQELADLPTGFWNDATVVHP